jgi:phosphoglycerate dehydrogenase-like enzyme
MKVLFCGQHFSGGFVYTRRAIQIRVQDAIQLVQCEIYEVPEEIKSATVVVCLMCKITEELIASAPNLKMIMQYGVGIEGVDILAASKRGIYVCNINSESCGNAQSCAEHCIYLATAIMRNVYELQKSLEMGRLGFPLGRTLYCSKIMLIGFGGMGKQLFPRLLAMGVSEITIVTKKPILLTSIIENLEMLLTIFPCQIHCVCFDEIFSTNPDLPRSPSSLITIDVLFLCCSVNAENKEFVNQQFLQQFNSGFYLINVSRVSV